MFKKKTPPPKPRERLSNKINWPDGSFVATETDVFFMKAGKRFRLYSPRVVSSWCANPIPVTEQSLSHVRKAGVLGFRDATLIKDLSDGRIYLIAGSKRHHVTNPDVLDALGYQIITVSHEEVLIHEEGGELNALGAA